MRGILAGATAAILAGLIWGFILQMAPQAYLAGLLSLLVGYIVGESISLATNRKRGTGLAVLAVCCVALSVCAAWMVYDGIFDVLLRRGSFVPLLLLGLSGYIAVYRVR
jgi:thiamine transporter ThiT